MGLKLDPKKAPQDSSRTGQHMPKRLQDGPKWANASKKNSLFVLLDMGLKLDFFVGGICLSWAMPMSPGKS